MAPGQQASPGLPQALQVFEVHAAQLSQVEPEQQGSVTPPHATQSPLTHTVVDAAQALPDWQQGWFKPPQAVQAPLVQLLPLSHVVPPQHGSLAAPQATHLSVWQMVWPWQEPPVQHGSLSAPQAVQDPL